MPPPASEPSPPADRNTPKNKRRKIQQACHTCRVRKTGCDGRQPCCTPCEIRGWQDRCSYSGTRSNPSALYVAHSLRGLTVVNAECPRSTRGILLTPARESTVDDLDRRLQRLEESAAVSLRTVEHLASNRANPKDPHDSQAQYEASHSTSTLHSSPAQDQLTSNSGSSNLSFVQRVTSVIDPSYNPSEDAPPGRVVSTAIGYSTSLPSSTDYNLKDLVLPPRHLADDMLKCYWDFFNVVYPVLHQPSFNAAYNLLWQPNHTTPDVLFYSTLNIVLALGCQRNEALAEIEREDLAADLYRRSVKLVSIDTLDKSSLQVVQLLVLRGFYLFYTLYADRCWVTVGGALRVAQAAGLQSTMRAVARNQIEREMRRRVWHCCVMIDWMASTSFARPPAVLGENPVLIPEAIDDEYLSDTSDGQQPRGVPSYLEFFVYSLKMLDIRQKFATAEPKHLETGEKSYSGEELGHVLDTISDLDRFLKTLPPHLQADLTSANPSSYRETCFRLQASVLKARVMYARLRMTRPFILVEASQCMVTSGDHATKTFTPNLRSRLQREICALSVSTAHETLEELHYQLSSIYRSSPWHTLYFTFAAASVLVAATLCPYLNVKLDQDPGKSSWNKALHIFEFHKAHVASAEKGIEALEKFRRFVQRRNTKIQATIELADSNVERIAAIDPGSLESTLDFTPNSTEYTLLDSNDLATLLPIDESWLASQDFDFNDIMLQWQ
ncbi:Fc.00g080180.m01.CDS01 [Cosmosporella sp. VM-42]